MGLIYPALALFDALPVSASARFAAALGSLAYAADTRRRNTACENIRRSGIAANEAEVRRIAKASFRHFAGVIADSLNTDRLFADGNWRNHVRMEIAPESMRILEDPATGVILASGHLGNWEIAAQFLSTIKPVVGITRRMNNPYADALMQERKPRHRFRLTPKHDADMGRFLAALKAGEALALLVDQHAPRTKGMPIDFFGTPASTHTSPALLHLITKTPLCFGYCVKTGPDAFLFKAPPPIETTRTGKRETDVRTILEALNRELEAAIRQYPEQYLWAHRRWR
jgi:KDO2-lipid IV(A) lauroyltransferase